MAFRIRTVDYYYVSVPGDPGEATEVLSSLSERGINLLAFAAIPMGPHQTQLTIFPDESPQLEDEASVAALRLDGPHPALLAQGDDELGALAAIHRRLSDAGIPVFSSSGVTDGRGGFGYVLYIRPDAVERAQTALGL
jgi:hypothetical protein